MGFPHLGLLRKLRQSMRHWGHAPLASVIDLPRFTYLDSNMLMRLPIALFTLACCMLSEISNPTVIRPAVPVFHMAVGTPLLGSFRKTASAFCTAYQIT